VSDKSRIFVFLFVAFFITGCATTRARRAETPDLQNQVTDLQGQLQTKDQQIEDLQYQLESQQQSLPGNSNISRGKSSAIRVAGVTVKAVQKALADKGLDPGPVDGRLGKKTKAAIKEFQKRNSLTADGVVGERTWNLLNK